MISEKQFTALIEDYLKGSDHFLIEVQIKPLNHIMVFIDGDHGVNIDACKALSRFLESKLDRDQEDFDLMVSSAGATRPLQVQRQYLIHLGKSLDVATNAGIKLEGVLLEADSNGIKIEQEIKITKKAIEKKVVELKYEEIKSAKIILNFKRA